MKSPVRRPRYAARVLVAAAALLIAGGIMFSLRPSPLSATEVACVGSWTYISPDHPSPTQIVYHFGKDRYVCEEHYYLTSAYPTVPRITMRGQWKVESDGRMVVEPRSGVAYVRDATSKMIGEYCDNGRSGWARPILTRFYNVINATADGIEVEANRGGGGGRVQWTMTPFDGAIRPQTKKPAA